MASLWQRFTSGIGLTRKAPDWGTLERYLAWAFGGGSSASGVIVNPQTAMQAAAVYASIKVLAESVAMLPCNLLRLDADGGVEKADDHPLFYLLHDQPNDFQTAVEFWEMVVLHLCLRGNCYAYVNRTQRGDVVEIIPQHPDMVRVTMMDNWQLKYSVAMPDGTFKDYSQGDILHFRGLTTNGWLGISPIAYARESIGLALATEKFGSQMFRNGAKMGGVLEHPGKLSDEAYKRVKESFDASTSGENAHKTALLEEGMKFAKVSMTGEDAQFLETRKYQRSEIASIFRVPPHMIGDMEKATFANVEDMAIQFISFALMPWLVRIEKTVKRDLFRPSEQKTMTLKFNTAALMRGNAKSRSEFYASGIVNGWMTRNEARANEAEITGAIMNPLEELDEPLMPLNMSVVGEEPVEPTGEVSDGTTAEPGTGGKPQNVPASGGEGSAAAGKQRRIAAVN